MDVEQSPMPFLFDIDYEAWRAREWADFLPEWSRVLGALLAVLPGEVQPHPRHPPKSLPRNTWWVHVVHGAWPLAEASCFLGAGRWLRVRWTRGHCLVWCDGVTEPEVLGLQAWPSPNRHTPTPEDVARAALYHATAAGCV